MKTITFKYPGTDDSISLGVPDNVEAKTGNFRDGGCELLFETSENSIGIKEKFSIYLFAEDVNAISRQVWQQYYKTEPRRAAEDFERFVKHFNSFCLQQK